MLNGGTTVQRTSGPLIPPALPQDITVLQKVPAGCLREILMEVCCLLTYPTSSSQNLLLGHLAVHFHDSNDFDDEEDQDSEYLRGGSVEQKRGQKMGF